jgi:hypothetical protein
VNAGNREREIVCGARLVKTNPGPWALQLGNTHHTIPRRPRYSKWAGGSRSLTHANGPLWAALLKVSYRCDVSCRRSSFFFCFLKDHLEVCVFITAVPIISVQKTYRHRYCANTVYVTVPRIKPIAGALARALPEGLGYLSTWAWLSSDRAELCVCLLLQGACTGAVAKP